MTGSIYDSESMIIRQKRWELASAIQGVKEVHHGIGRLDERLAVVKYLKDRLAGYDGMLGHGGEVALLIDLIEAFENEEHINV